MHSIGLATVAVAVVLAAAGLFAGCAAGDSAMALVVEVGEREAAAPTWPAAAVSAGPAGPPPPPPRRRPAPLMIGQGP